MKDKNDTYVDRKTGTWVLFSTICASSMAFIDFSALNVALPAIQSAFDARGSELLWVVNGDNLMLASLILVGGSLGDKLGRKKVFMIGIFLFTVSSIFCGFAPSVSALITGRVVQGIGGALMIPGSLAILTASFPPDRRGGAIGTWSAATTITMIAVPIIGGFLAQAGLWRIVFFLNVPLAAAALSTLILSIPESRDTTNSQRIDFSGGILATVSLVGLAYGFTSAAEIGFARPRIIVSLGIGLMALIGFIFTERRIKDPMVPFALFRSKTFSGANLLTLFLYGALAAYSLFLSLNVIQVQGYRESLAGLVFIPFVLLLAVMSRWTGKLVDRIGSKLLLFTGPFLTGVGFFLTSFIGLTEGPGDYWRTFFPAIIMFGVGMGFTVAPLTTTVMSAVPTHFAGTASGINNATSRIAGVLAIAILGTIALISFSSTVSDQTARMQLPAAAHEELRQQALRFGDASVPESVPEELQSVVDLSIKSAFIRAFRKLMYICTGLAWMSAMMAVFLVESRSSKSGKTRAV